MHSNKKCSYCSEVKSFDDFYKDKRKPDGLYSRCKFCISMIAQKKTDKMILENLRPERKYISMSEEVKSRIIELYVSGVGSYKIAKIVGYTKSSVLNFITTQRLVRVGARYRKHKFKNENYFDVIDTDEKAYFLGLLWADGCNYRRDGKAYQIVISLQDRDGYIIRELANNIFENDDIVRFVDKSTDYDDFNRQHQISLRIPSKHMSDVLLNYGMLPRKSSILEMPININWTEDLYRSFIRGFFDGDGSIYLNSNSRHYGVNFISSVQHMTQMNVLIEQYFGKKMSFELKTNYQIPMAGLTFHGNQISKKFLDWLYKNSTTHLKRKYDKYLELKQVVELGDHPKSTTIIPSTIDQSYHNS